MVPNPSRARARTTITQSNPMGVATMTNIRQAAREEEPRGIVISRGSREETTPRFWAYVYSEEPETSDRPSDVKAA